MEKFIKYSNKVVDGSRNIDVSVNVPSWIAVPLIAIVVAWIVFK